MISRAMHLFLQLRKEIDKEEIGIRYVDITTKYIVRDLQKLILQNYRWVNSLEMYSKYNSPVPRYPPGDRRTIQEYTRSTRVLSSNYRKDNSGLFKPNRG